METNESPDQARLSVPVPDRGPQEPPAWLLSAQDWHAIEAGVQQRARLLQMILADVYQDQHLLQQGLIPPALVYGHPGYLRAMHRMNAVTQHLHLIAFDLTRGADGQWCLVSPHTDVPSGLGTLLNDDAADSQLSPAADEALPHLPPLPPTSPPPPLSPVSPQLLPLKAAGQPLLSALRAQSPAGSASHIALLTPGPGHQSHADHAALAQQLGLTLAEASMLSVRDRQLWLQTAHGQVAVHVLLKCVGDASIDPLELRADAASGVPGLLQAVRAGKLVIANAPGSGWLESPALLGFLPALATQLLGQPLQLPALDTWWCGERAALDDAQTQWRSCVVKPAYPHSSRYPHAEPLPARALSEAQWEAWRSRIMRDPDAYVLQRALPTTSTQGAIMQEAFMLRVFALSTGPHHWQVVPGGLAWLASADGELASMPSGGRHRIVRVRSTMSGPVYGHAYGTEAQACD